MNTVRLYCLPYAGGSAAIYRDWPQALPAWIGMSAMHLPGRGVRFGAGPVHEWRPLVERLADDIRVDDPRPYALFGHSMGALLALEIAFELRHRHGTAPVWIGASGCTAPRLRDQHSEWLDCSDAALVAEMRRLGGTPEELLTQREWLDLVLPSVRADFHLCGTHRHRRRPPLDAAISVFTGDRDPLTAAPERRTAWREEAGGRFADLRFGGDHFFFHGCHDAVVAAVVGELGHAMAAAAPPGAGDDGKAGRCSA